MSTQILSLILREHWAIDQDYAMAARPLIHSMLQGKEVNLSQFATPENFMTSFVLPDGRQVYFNPDEDQQSQELPEGTIALIGISGVMQKFGGLCSLGTEELASMLDQALSVDQVIGSVIRFHSPGGTVNSVIPLKRAMSERSKPVVALVDSMAGSAAYYIACMADEVMAVDPLAEIGSIGAMATIINDSEKWKKEGIELVRIYAPQSTHKNKPAMAAMEGKTDLYENEVLAPIADNFIEHVRKYRKGKLNENKKGLLAGQMYYADDAIKYGLADSMGSLPTAIKRVRTLSTRRQILTSIR